VPTFLFLQSHDQQFLTKDTNQTESFLSFSSSNLNKNAAVTDLPNFQQREKI
jgi:hypothetical protein